MKQGARIQEAFMLWGEYDFSKPADDYLHFELKSKRYIGSSDRRAIREFFYQLLRHQISLSAMLSLVEKRAGKKWDPFDAHRLMLIFYFKMYGEISEIDDVFSGHKYNLAPLNDEEREILDSNLPILDEASLLNLPDFWYEKLKEKCGASLSAAVASMEEQAPLDLRVNTLKMSRDEGLNLLKLRGVDASPTPYAPFGVRVMDKASFNHTDLVMEGSFEPQDEGSQLISLMCGAKPGMRVMDFCAGAGGKTLGLAMDMQNRGAIIASDIMEFRLKRAKERLNRLGVHNASLKMVDAQWIKKHAGEFDRVLVDAPCSGSGTWRRNPDLKLRMGADDIKELCEKQHDILISASRLVKKGGRLVYATCSLIEEENDGQVQQFLGNHPEFKLLDLHTLWDQETPPPCATPTWSLTPWEHGTDGFFIAVMQRKED